MTAAAPPARRRPGVVTGLLVGLAVIALLLTGLAGWWGWGSDAVARSRVRDQLATFERQPTAAPVDATAALAAPAGTTMAVLVIPRLGLTWPIVTGIESLERGVGWYADTTYPGLPGNTVLTGLRVSGGSPFRRLLSLDVGDEIVIQTPTKRLVYLVKVAPRDLTVDREVDWVLDPVPGRVNAVPTESVLTLITSQDLLASRERSVAFAVLKS